MELRTTSGRLSLGGAFKLIATGYLVGAGAIFIPLFVLATVVGLLVGAPATMNGQIVEGGARVFVSLAPLVMLPVILALQALMFGGLGVVGLWLYSRYKPIRVVEAPDA